MISEVFFCCDLRSQSCTAKNAKTKSVVMIYSFISIHLQSGENDEPRKPDDFVFVDKANQLSDEEKFEKRLNEALEKMLAMGFDNDGGWLSQLLITKDLSIDRVLEALNPSS